MNNPNSNVSKDGSQAAPEGTGFSPWRQLKTKKISYLTLPLIVMATITEFVILATGWRYQKTVCLPQGMGVTFFGIGPIGATILAVELLKLPLAIWTASRHGWQKLLMVTMGLPCICLLTFQLVKDMAVYEMGVALAPASHFLDLATAEDEKAAQLKNELADIQAKKTERENKLAELSAQQAKTRSDLDEALKRNDESRKDAVDLTDYQQSQLRDVDAREAAITQQANAETEAINKSLTDLRARRETELARDAQWNAEEARIDNDYKAKLADYQNKQAQYQREKAAYDSANIIKRQLMKTPVDPGVPPVREDNTLLKSSILSDLDNQIRAKEDELKVVDTQQRDRVAQVENDARDLRQQFQGRSGTKRDEADTNRAALLAAQSKLDEDFQGERKQMDADLAAAVQKVDGIQSQLDAALKQAETYYEQREAAIRTTQVHRIATTVEIIREMVTGQHPMSIRMTAKERGDILTDQISMVRVWVYPVLAFIVAFLPTLMVEIGFSTVFKPEKTRPNYRVGFLGRRLHWLYTRAGRLKMIRFERMAKEATSRSAARDRAAAAEKGAVEKALQENQAKLRATERALANAGAERDAKLKQLEERLTAEAQQKEQEWVAKLAAMADSLNRTVVEKDSLRDLQRFEVDRQIQLRQNAWSENLRQAHQELEEQRARSEAERAAMVQEHHKKLLELTEESKAQVLQARRQAAEAETAAAEAAARLKHELKEALHAREAAEMQMKQQSESLNARLQRVKEEAKREVESTMREEKLRLERDHIERDQASQQYEQKFEKRLKQREQELSMAFEARLAEERGRVEQEARRRESELERQVEVRTQEIETRRKQELAQKEEAFQFKLKQREQQLQSQTEGRLTELHTQTEQEMRRRDAEFERQLEAQTREATARLKQELQQKELLFEARLKHREQELAARAAARETELQNQWNAQTRTREEEWERQAAARLQAAEQRLAQEAQQREEDLLAKARQREKQLQSRLDNMRTELQGEQEEMARRRGLEVEAVLGELESQLRKEIRPPDRNGALEPALGRKA